MNGTNVNQPEREKGAGKPPAFRFMKMMGLMTALLIALLTGCADDGGTAIELPTPPPESALATPDEAAPTTAVSPTPAPTTIAATATAVPPTPTPTAAASDGTAVCPQETTDHAVFISPESDYCFRYPADFELTTPIMGIVVVDGPPLEEGQDPLRAFLTIEKQGPANGRDAAQFAEDQLAGFIENDVPLTTEPTTFGGQPAVLAEGIPGTTLTRQLFTVYDGVTYIFTLSPVDPRFPQAVPDIERLWEAVSDSFTFTS